MAEKILNTRIQLKRDTYANWMASTIQLKPGEFAVAEIPAETGALQQEPAVVVKVGCQEGNKTFAELPFLTAKAGDVYSWAKGEHAPDTTYSVSLNTTDTNNLLVYSYNPYVAGDDGQLGTAKKVADLVITDDQLTARVAELEEMIGLEDGKSVGEQIEDAIEALDLPNTYAGKEATETAISNVNKALNDYKTANDKALADEIARAKQAEETNAAAAKAAQDDVDALETQVGELPAGTTATTVFGYVDEKVAAGDKAINDKIGEVTEGKTVVEMIEEAQAAATYDDTQVKADIKANADAIDAIEEDYLKAADKQELQGNIDTEKARIDTLVGSDTGKSARTIANEELAAKLIPADAQEALNTLEEIAAWIQDHPEDASAMNERILALEAIDHEHANKALLDTYTQTEANLADAVAKKHSHDNKTVLDGITADKVAAWDASEKNAKDYADGLNTAMDTRVKAVEGKVATWDNAVQTVTPGTGLTAVKTGTDVAIGIDESVTFIFDCGDSGVTAE